MNAEAEQAHTAKQRSNAQRRLRWVTGLCEHVWAHGRDGFVLHNDPCDLPRETCGIYLLWLDEELIYIGVSVDVRKRLMSKNHRVYRRELQIAVITLTEIVDWQRRQETVGLERALIGILRPPRNYRAS